MPKIDTRKKKKKPLPDDQRSSPTEVYGGIDVERAFQDEQLGMMCESRMVVMRYKAAKERQRLNQFHSIREYCV